MTTDVRWHQADIGLARRETSMASTYGRGQRGPLFEAFAVFWVVFWVVVGVGVAIQVWSLARVAETAEASAAAADQAGQALQQLSELPLIGEGPAQLGDEVRAAAQEAAQNARATRSDVRVLSILLGVSVALIPSASLLVMYLPQRLTARREARTLRAQLAASDGRGAVDAYLAHQALANIPFDELRKVSANPVADLVEGRYAELAAAEIDRLETLAGRRR